MEKLLTNIRQRRIDVVVVYKVDRLTRSLADFAKLVEVFDGDGVAYVSVTRAFNTTTGMGRLTLNLPSGSGTRSPRRRKRAFGSAGWFRSATRSGSRS